MLKSIVIFDKFCSALFYITVKMMTFFACFLDIYKKIDYICNKIDVNIA